MFDYEQAVAPTKRPAKARQTAAIAPRGCSWCHGRPWVDGERGARRCDCERGQFFAAKDRERAGASK